MRNPLPLALACGLSVAACSSGGSAPTAGSGPAPLSRADTVHIPVGSDLVRGDVYEPHTGRVIKLAIAGDRVDTTAIWVNRLEIGDSAGRRVHRWHTGGFSAPGGGERTRFDLWTTFDAQTLALLGWHLEAGNGTQARIAADGGRVRGTLRKPGESVPADVEFVLPVQGFAAGAADLIPYAVGLREGLTMTLPLWTPPGSEVKTEHWTVTGRSPIEFRGRATPSWEMQHFAAPSGKLLGTIWFVDEPPYVVRWDLYNPDGTTTRMIGEWMHHE